jgi:MFS family permease
MAIAPLGPVLARRGGSRVPLIAGAALAAVGYGSLAWANHAVWQVSLALLVAGAGVGLAFAAVATLTIDAVPGHQRGQASGVNTIMRTIGGTLGTTTAAMALTAGTGSLASFQLCFAMFAAALALCGWLAWRVPPAPEREAATIPPIAGRPACAR